MKLKTFLFTLIAALIAVPIAYSAVDNWYPANQRTVAWDAVTTLEDGTPLPEGSTVSYEVFYAKEDKTGQMSLGITSATSFTVTLPAEGKYIIGVQAIRNIVGVDPIRSTMAWSDDPTKCQNGATFGIIFYIKPGNVGGLRG